jgi:hypothetical protein
MVPVGDDWFVGDLNNKGWKIMQYTGLKDKNGKEIYEGDVLRVAKTISEEPEFAYATVIFKDGVFYGWGMLCTNHKYSEVMGNIYENPDLIENGSNI